MIGASQNHWLSYQPSRREHIAGSRGCESTITVVLDAGAREHFSGIRILVVCSWVTCDFDWDLCAIRSSLDVFDDSQDRFTLRNQLLHRKKVRSYNTHLSSRPLCTFVFELCQLPATSALTLHLRSDRLYDSTSERLCILHDLTYPYPTLYATFNTWGHLYPSLMTEMRHNIRVLPLPTLRQRASAVSSLPNAIIMSIVRHALGKKDFGWRADLMYYGTVCRAWVPTLDLFFESAQSRHCKDRPTAFCVARALEQRPDRRALLGAFLPAAYREYYDSRRYSAFSQTCVRILGLATAVRYVYLPVVASSVWDELVGVLQRLQGVRRCSLSSQSIHRSSAVIRSYSVDDIQTIVGNWEHLRTLRIEGWTVETPSKEVHRQLYHLKELRLVAGHLTGDQILRFVPSVPVSTLKKLHLISISGLTNNDLFSLLSLVSPTLEELYIQSTPTHRAGVDEPYALDATIPNMSRLKSVTLDGDHASALTIARKGPGSRKRQMGQSEIRGTITLIVHTEFEVVHARSIIRALETTGWKHVMVWWNRKIAWDADTAWDDATFAMKATSIQARGVHLRFRFFDRSVRLTPDVIEYKPGWSPLLL
ncbi:hypothetical protein E4T56_gene19079 [Termitomyces sp. T112]|nr:hypothetical protein E4T56_gene19079 [Termitomyces sp. T112]